MIDLKLTENNSDNCNFSNEELLLDIVDIQSDLNERDNLIHSLESLEFIYEQILTNGLTDTVKAMVGDQIKYDSKESLLISMEGIIEDIVRRMAYKGASSDSGLTYRAYKSVMQKTISLVNTLERMIRKNGEPASIDNVSLKKWTYCIGYFDECDLKQPINDALNGKSEYVNQTLSEINQWISGNHKYHSLPLNKLIHQTKTTLVNVQTLFDDAIHRFGEGAPRMGQKIESAVEKNSSAKMLTAKILKAYEKMIITIAKSVIKITLDYRKWMARNKHEPEKDIDSILS